MHNRFKVIAFNLDASQPIDASYIAIINSELTSRFNARVDANQRIILELNDSAELISHDSLLPLLDEMNLDEFKLIVEYNPATRQISAFHECYFSNRPDQQLQRINVDHLYLRNKKYPEPDAARLMQSVCYGLLKDIAMHNAGSKETAWRGIDLIDYLYANPPKEADGIVTKETSSQLLALKFFSKKHKCSADITNKIAQHINFLNDVPLIDFNNIDFDLLHYALENVGSFILIGVTIDHFKAKVGGHSLQNAKDVLNLPLEVLDTVKNEDFSGFQNLLDITTVRNQRAFHFNPKRKRVPEGYNEDRFNLSFNTLAAIAYVFNRKIGVRFQAKPEEFTDYRTDMTSVFTSRKYYKKVPGKIGAQEHSDMDELTLIYSNESGLEIKRDDKYCHVPAYEVAVNMGDWGLVKLNKSIKFRAGLHRVLEVEKERHSVIFFLNPPKNQKAKMPNGETIAFSDLLYHPENKPMYFKRK